MNAMVIAAPVETFSRDGLRVVKTTTLRTAPAGTPFFVNVHDEGDIIRRVLSVDFDNDLPVKAWVGDMGMDVAVEGRGVIHFQNHTYGGPKYPVARIKNDKTGNVRNVRMTFFTKDTVEPSATLAKAAEPPVTVEPAPVAALPKPAETEMTIEERFPKLVKSNFPDTGKFLAACRERKAAMRAAGVSE